MKNQIHSIRRLSLALLTLALGAVSACGVDDEADTTETSEGALILPPLPPDISVLLQTCQRRSPDAIMTRRGNEDLISPTNYGTSGCPKAYVVDAAPPTLYADDRTILMWADPWPRSETQCTGGKLRMVLGSKAPGDLQARNEGTFEAPLTWDASEKRCQYTSMWVFHRVPTSQRQESWGVAKVGDNGVGLPETSIRSLAGRTLRLVASALTPAGNTQPLKVIATGL